MEKIHNEFTSIAYDNVVEVTLMTRILITDDEDKIRSLIAKYAHHEGFETDQSSILYATARRTKRTKSWICSEAPWFTDTSQLYTDELDQLIYTRKIQIWITCVWKTVVKYR